MSSRAITHAGIVAEAVLGAAGASTPPKLWEAPSRRLSGHSEGRIAFVTDLDVHGTFATEVETNTNQLTIRTASGSGSSILGAGQSYLTAGGGLTTLIGIEWPSAFGVLHALTTGLWLRDANAVIDELCAKASAEGASLPTHTTVTYAKSVLSVCSGFDVPEPVTDLDENGNIEIFFKRGASGVLFVVAQNGVLQIFGNTHSENWRARYDLSGNTWASHLGTFLSSLTIS